MVLYRLGRDFTRVDRRIFRDLGEALNTVRSTNEQYDTSLGIRLYGVCPAP